MAYFYGTIAGQRAAPIGMGGTKANGLTTYAASYKGAIRVEVYVDDDGDDAFAITEQQWEGTGIRRWIAQGKIGKGAEADALIDPELRAEA